MESETIKTAKEIEKIKNNDNNIYNIHACYDQNAEYNICFEIGDKTKRFEMAFSITELKTMIKFLESQ